MIKEESMNETIVTKAIAYEKLQLKDDFMFGKVMSQKDLCIEMLEILTENTIEDVKYIDNQKAVKLTNDSKGIRYDVYVEDVNNRLYDAEMQNEGNHISKSNLPKRSRYYQGMIDLKHLEKGTEYNNLKESYVIFICTYDPFGKGLCKYTFKNVCMDDNELILHDYRNIIFFNTKGTEKNVSDRVFNFLSYIETNVVNDSYVKRLDKAVESARENKEWMVDYMKTIVHDMDVRNEGREEGLADGLAQGLAKGLTAIIQTLSMMCDNSETIYEKIIQTDAYKDITKEQVEEIYNTIISSQKQ